MEVRERIETPNPAKSACLTASVLPSCMATLSTLSAASPLPASNSRNESRVPEPVSREINFSD